MWYDSPTSRGYLPLFYSLVPWGCPFSPISNRPARPSTMKIRKVGDFPVVEKPKTKRDRMRDRKLLKKIKQKKGAK